MRRVRIKYPSYLQTLKLLRPSTKSLTKNSMTQIPSRKAGGPPIRQGTPGSVKNVMFITALRQSHLGDEPSPHPKILSRSDKFQRITTSEPFVLVSFRSGNETEAVTFLHRRLLLNHEMNDRNRGLNSVNLPVTHTKMPSKTCNSKFESATHMSECHYDRTNFRIPAMPRLILYFPCHCILRKYQILICMCNCANMANTNTVTFGHKQRQNFQLHTLLCHCQLNAAESFFRS